MLPDVSDLSAQLRYDDQVEQWEELVKNAIPLYEVALYAQAPLEWQHALSGSPCRQEVNCLSLQQTYSEHISVSWNIWSALTCTLHQFPYTFTTEHMRACKARKNDTLSKISRYQPISAHQTGLSICSEAKRDVQH